MPVKSSQSSTPLTVQVRLVQTLKIRYDTAENLVLRKILNPSNAAHRAILRGAKEARKYIGKVFLLLQSHMRSGDFCAGAGASQSITCCTTSRNSKMDAGTAASNPCALSGTTSQLMLPLAAGCGYFVKISS